MGKYVLLYLICLSSCRLITYILHSLFLLRKWDTFLIDSRMQWCFLTCAIPAHMFPQEFPNLILSPLFPFWIIVKQYSIAHNQARFQYCNVKGYATKSFKFLEWLWGRHLEFSTSSELLLSFFIVTPAEHFWFWWRPTGWNISHLLINNNNN